MHEPRHNQTSKILVKRGAAEKIVKRKTNEKSVIDFLKSCPLPNSPQKKKREQKWSLHRGLWQERLIEKEKEPRWVRNSANGPHSLSVEEELQCLLSRSDDGWSGGLNGEARTQNPKPQFRELWPPRMNSVRRISMGYSSQVPKGLENSIYNWRFSDAELRFSTWLS